MSELVRFIVPAIVDGDSQTAADGGWRWLDVQPVELVQGARRSQAVTAA